MNFAAVCTAAAAITIPIELIASEAAIERVYIRGRVSIRWDEMCAGNRMHHLAAHKHTHTRTHARLLASQ